MKLGQTSLIYSVSQFIGSALGFLATIYFARELGETVLGQYALVLTVVTWVGIGGKVGLNKAITKRISEGEEPEQFMGGGLIVMAVLMTTVAVFVVIFRGQVNAYVGAPVAEFVIVLLFASLLKSFVSASLKGNHLVHVYAGLSALKQGVSAAVQIALVVVGFGLAGMLWGYAFGYFLTAAIGLTVLGLRPALPSREHIISLFEYAKYSWLGSMQSKTFDTIDIAVLGLFVTQGLIGIYAVAWSLGKFLDIFGTAVSNTLFPEMSKVSAADEPSAAAGLTEDALSYAGFILIPGLVGAIVIGDRLLLVYEAAFVAGANILVILIFALLIYTYNEQLLNTLNAIDRPDLAFRSNAVFIGTNVLLNLLLIWQFGWIGAAIATALSAAVGLVLSFQYARQQVPFTVPSLEIGRQWIAAVGMGGLVYGIRYIGESRRLGLVEAYNTVFVVLLVGIGAGTYVVLLLALSRRFRATVVRNLPFEIRVGRFGN